MQDCLTILHFFFRAKLFFGGEGLSSIKKSFMPMSIDYTDTSKVEKKLFILLLVLIVSVALSVVLFKIYDYNRFLNFLGTTVFIVLGESLVFLGASKLIRIFVINEKDLIRSAENMKMHDNTDLQDLWEIASIDDQKITMYDNTIRVLVKCQRGYVIGRPDGFEDNHRQRLANFVGYLCNHDYIVDYYDCHVNDINEQFIASYEQKVNELESEALREVGNAYLRKCKFIEGHNIFPTCEYFIVSTQSGSDFDYQRLSILTDVKAAMEHLRGSQYIDFRICRKREIVSFFEIVFNVSGINPKKLAGKGLDDMDELLVYVKDITYYDESKIVNFVADETPEPVDEDSKRNKLFADKIVKTVTYDDESFDDDDESFDDDDDESFDDDDDDESFDEEL